MAREVHPARSAVADDHVVSFIQESVTGERLLSESLNGSFINCILKKKKEFVIPEKISLPYSPLISNLGAPNASTTWSYSKVAKASLTVLANRVNGRFG